MEDTKPVIKRSLQLILCITLTLSVGGIGGIATASGVNDWYLTIQKPSFNPPNYLFGPVWTLLYVLMGVSFYMILQGEKSKLRTRAIQVFFIQLLLNFMWSFIFFKFHSTGLAFFEIILTWSSILLMILIYFNLNKTAAYLQIPYIIWVTFASILSGTIYFIN